MDYFSPEVILLGGIIVGIALTLAVEIAIVEFHNK